MPLIMKPLLQNLFRYTQDLWPSSGPTTQLVTYDPIRDQWPNSRPMTQMYLIKNNEMYAFQIFIIYNYIIMIIELES